MTAQYGHKQTQPPVAFKKGRVFVNIARLTAMLCLVIAGLSACDQDRLFQKLIPQEEATEGQRILSMVAARDFKAIESRLDNNLRDSAATKKLEQIANYMPQEQPKSITTIGAHTFQGPSDTRYTLTYEYEFEKTWMIASVDLRRTPSQLMIAGITANLTPQSQKALNAFTLKGKGAIHFVFLALVITIPMFILSVLVACYRTPIPRRKWLWYLFIAVGIVQFNLDWTTGAWGVQPISFLVLGAGYGQTGPFAPYILTFGLPIGAVVFLARRRSLTAGTSDTAAAATSGRGVV